MVTIEERVSRLEGAYEQVDRRLGGIEDRLIETNQNTNARFDEMNQNTNARFDEMNSRINTLITVVVGSAATLAVGIAAGFIALFIALG